MPAALPAALMDSRTTPAAGIPVPSPDSAARAESGSAGMLEVKSPMVGTYYAAAEPGGKAYVTVGNRVQKGQTLCIIEAMKIMNEIESEFSGVVKEILAQDAHPVEYGQVLFRIDPNG
jgi:acetyl-CoA carboxylase biotin carboxyl carrier protein